MDQNSIEELLGRVALRDRKAFSDLYDRTSAKLFGVALRILNDRMEAEEALQEAYINVWRRSQSFKAGRASPMSWLIAVARNAAIDRLRKRKNAGAEMDDAIWIADDGPSPEDAAMAASDHARIAECMEELEPDHAKTVRRAFYSGRTYAEIAEAAGMPLGTVKSWIRRSLSKLRQCLERLPAG